MATLKEFEDALRSYNMVSALAVLEELRKRDRAMREVAMPRRVTAKKMTVALARQVLEMHRTTTMTQQEIAFKLGVNQGRVNEVVKHGKWLTEDPKAPERVVREQALKRVEARRQRDEKDTPMRPVRPRMKNLPPQLSLGDI